MLMDKDTWALPLITPRPARGFFYENPGDIVKCFSCGGTLNDWQPNDDPWLEHAHWFPHCSYLIQMKGSEIVETSMRNYGDLLTGGGDGNRQTSNVTPSSSPPASSDGHKPDAALKSSTTPVSNMTSSASKNITTSQAASDHQPGPKCHQEEHAYLRDRLGNYMASNAAATTRLTGDPYFHLKTMEPSSWAVEKTVAIAAAWLATEIHVWHGPSKLWLSFPGHLSGFEPLTPAVGCPTKGIYIRNEDDHFEPVYAM